MYTEIVKIIEGGLKKDPSKVLSYARLLASNLEKEGQSALASKILKIINSTKGSAVYLDQLISTPVDNESRLNIVDIFSPTDSSPNFIMSKNMSDSIGQFIDKIQHRNELQAAGIDVHSSLLLYGPPGCGKTSAAQYIAGLLNLPLVVARLDSLVSSLLGNTAKNIRKAFEFAQNQPCILFLDEFDAIAKARDDQHEMGELKRVINSLLQNIDEYTNNNILIAATNHPELLDRAIWRRFNNIIEFSYPKKEELVSLLKLYFNNLENSFLEDNKKIDRLYNLLAGLSPSDIKVIVQNTIAKSIIDKTGVVLFENLLYQVFLFKTHGSYTSDQLVSFFKEQEVPQRTMKNIFNIPFRQIRQST